MSTSCAHSPRVTRVAREVGTEALGGRPTCRAARALEDLTDGELHGRQPASQVRGIAKVVTAVADGDLKQKLTVEAKGEISALTTTINE